MPEIALLSLTGAAIWAALYLLDAGMRRRKAARNGEKPELFPMRMFWLISGISGQVFYWQAIILFKEWGGMN